MTQRQPYGVIWLASRQKRPPKHVDSRPTDNHIDLYAFHDIMESQLSADRKQQSMVLTVLVKLDSRKAGLGPEARHVFGCADMESNGHR